MEWEKSYDQWLQETRQKVDEGLRQVERGEVLDGEVVMNQLRETMQKVQEEAYIAVPERMRYTPTETSLAVDGLGQLTCTSSE